MGECERCKKPGHQVQLQGAHIIPRGYFSTRFRIENGFSLCWGCHRFFHYRQLEWEAFVENQIGLRAYLGLKARAMVPAHFTVDDLQDIATGLARDVRDAGVLVPSGPGGWTPA